MTRGSKTKKPSRDQPRSVWADQTVTENPDAPAFRKEIQGLKWKRRALTFIAYGAVPAILLMGAGMMAQANTPATGDDGTASVTVNGSQGKSEAFRALNTWLDSTPAPLPGGSIVSWDGYTVESAPAPKDDPEARKHYNFETHTFTVKRGSSMWRANVQVAVGDVIGATVTGPPSLTPVPAAEVSTSETWFDLEPTSSSASVQQAVDAWAAAYTGGDADKLHQIVQDRNTSRSYLPLQGVQEFVGAEITAAGARSLGDGEGVDSSTIVVRVQLQFWWKGGKPSVSKNDPDPVPTPVGYDLLVQHADTATPVVVAWGAPGSGPSLKPYGNAIAAQVESTPDDAQTQDAVEGVEPSHDDGSEEDQ